MSKDLIYQNTINSIKNYERRIKEVEDYINVLQCRLEGWQNEIECEISRNAVRIVTEDIQFQVEHLNFFKTLLLREQQSCRKHFGELYKDPFK